MASYTDIRYFTVEPSSIDFVQPGDMKRVGGVLSQWNGTTWDVISTGAVSENELAPAGGDTLNAMRMAKFNYNFGDLGGTQGDIALTGSPLPIGSIVLGGFLVASNFKSDGNCNLRIDLANFGDLAANSSASGKAWTGIKRVKPSLTEPEKAITLAVASAPSLVVSDADLTSGQMDLFLIYFVGS